MPDVIVTSYGTVLVGPRFRKCLDNAEFDMATHSKRTKAYRFAKARKADVERAAELLASIYWEVDDDLKKTP